MAPFPNPIRRSTPARPSPLAQVTNTSTPSSSPAQVTTTPSAPSSSSAHISLALIALTFFQTASSQKGFRNISGGLDPFTSIHSIHLFVTWLASLPVRQSLSSDLLLVAWAVQGLPPGLRSLLEWSLAWEDIPEESLNLEYLLWHLEMWRSVFSSTIVVEFARKRGMRLEPHIADWFANGPNVNKEMAQKAAQEYWHRFTGKKGM